LSLIGKLVSSVGRVTLGAAKVGAKLTPSKERSEVSTLKLTAE